MGWRALSQVQRVGLTLGLLGGGISLTACGSGDDSGLTASGGSGAQGGAGAAAGTSSTGGSSGVGGSTAAGSSAGGEAGSGGSSAGTGGAGAGGSGATGGTGTAGSGASGGAGTGGSGATGGAGNAGSGGEAGNSGSGGGVGAGAISCGTAICGIIQGELCCSSQSSGLSCVQPNQCTCTGILCSTVEIRCDGSNDCSGQICCLEKNIASSPDVACRATCDGGITVERSEVCRLDVPGTCTKGSCMITNQLPPGYGLCQ